MARIGSPTAILEARGSFKSRPEKRNPEEPVSGGIGPAPKWLTVEQRSIWDETVSNCAPGVFQSADRQALEDYVRLRAESRGDWSKFGVRKIALMLSFMSRFGMTPADRVKVHVPKKPPKNGEAVGLAKYVS